MEFEITYQEKCLILNDSSQKQILEKINHIESDVSSIVKLNLKYLAVIDRESVLSQILDDVTQFAGTGNSISTT